MSRFFAKLLAAFALLAAFPAVAQPVDTGHLEAELVARDQSIAPGATTYVALRQKIDKGWHTYWRNSGDSGEATRIEWTLPPGWTAGDIVWPAPKRQPTGPLMNYGYQDEVLLPVPVTAPAGAKPGETVTLKAAATFLVCEEICVPEDAVLTISLPVREGLAEQNPAWGAAIAKTLAEAPAPAGLDAAFQKKADGSLALAITGAPLKGADMADAYFFPFDSTVIDHAKPQAIERGPEGLTLAITAGYAFQQPEMPKTLAGVLTVGGKSYEVSAAEGPLSPAASGLGPPPAKRGGSDDGALGLPLAVAFAFLGGLILNLMPCVFPILAMKAASLAGHAHERRAAQGQGIAFLAGVLATFLVLAGVLIAIRAGGAAVGWGFQLQSPPVVAGLALLMLAVALNLSGVFEVGASLQGVGSSLASSGGMVGAFFTGALAVIVAAPCTAPFMAPALGWALTQSAPAAIAVFLALGLGFAAPFALIAFAPGLLSRLPKPGPWMDGFKKLLAFPMFGAAAWLVWVLTLQSGETALARIFAAAVVLALALWLLGAAQRRQAAGGRPAVLTGLGALLVIVAALAAVWPNYGEGTAVATSAGSVGKASVPYEAYSREKLAAARAAGKPVFVNFTAAWCVTCQVNERVALTSQSVADAFKETGAVYLKADWTRKDAEIEQELAKHGRAGVPLYLVYGARGGDGVILPQILTEGLVVRALKDAQGR